MKKQLLLIAFALAATTLLHGQGFEPARKINYLKLSGTNHLNTRGLNSMFNPNGSNANVDSLLGSGSEYFQQVAVNMVNSLPKVSIKAIKLYAKLGKKTFLDFYVLSSVPLTTTNPQDSAKNLGTELQNLYGGLVNSYFSKTWYVNQEPDFQTRGLQIDVKAGYKLTETSKEQGTSNVYLSSGQVATELRFLIPVFGNPTDTALAGLVQIKLNGQALYSNSSDYNSFFKASDGKNPSPFLLSSTAELSIHIFNQFYLSGGYSFGSISSINNYGYFKLSYSRK